MISLKIYKYIIYIVILILLLVGFFIFKKEFNNSIIKFGFLWVILLFIFNAINVIFTLTYYDENKDKKGIKGIKGSNGQRGFRGKSLECTQCGLSGKKMKTLYASDVNDFGVKIKNNKEIRVGKCIFPFAFDNEFVYEPVKKPRKENEVNDAFKFGWCATSLNPDKTYKTYGYANMSEIIEKQKEKQLRRSQKRSNYILSNTGLLDVKLAVGNRSTVKCPSGYSKIDSDLNALSGGKYIYVCKKTGLAGSGMEDLMTVDVSDNYKCPKGYNKLPYDLNKDSGGSEIYLCKKRTNKNFITDIKVQNSDECPADYDLSTGNLNKGSGGDPVYICTTKKRTSIMAIDTAFVYGGDKALYFFKGDKFWKFNNKAGQVYPEYPKNIMELWGKLPSDLNAVFTYGFNGKTYFFKGDQFWEYDEKRQNIAAGYPKYIRDVWKGVPNDIDTVFTYDKDGKTYFVKGKFYYRYNDREKRVDRGYPKSFVQRFNNAPHNINAMFSYNYDNKTYIIRADQYWVLNKKSEIASGYPKKLNTKFAGIY